MYQGTYEHTKWKEDLTRDLSEFPGDEDHSEQAYQEFVHSTGGKTWNEFTRHCRQSYPCNWRQMQKRSPGWMEPPLVESQRPHGRSGSDAKRSNSNWQDPTAISATGEVFCSPISPDIFHAGSVKN